MRTLFYLIATAFLSTGAMFAGLNGHHLLLGYGAGLLLWALFLRYLLRKK